jgi:hypothetical protein
VAQAMEVKTIIFYSGIVYRHLNMCVSHARHIIFPFKVKQ